jgi:hypothetical protein
MALAAIAALRRYSDSCVTKMSRVTLVVQIKPPQPKRLLLQPSEFVFFVVKDIENSSPTRDQRRCTADNSGFSVIRPQSAASSK